MEIELERAIETMFGAGYGIALLCHRTAHGFLRSSGRYRLTSQMFFGRIVSAAELIQDAAWWRKEFGEPEGGT